MARVLRRGLPISLLVLACALGIRAAGEADGPSRIDIQFEPYGDLRWDRGRRPVLVVEPRRGDGWISIAQRVCGTSGDAGALRESNPGLAQPMRDRGLRVPVELLKADLRLEAVRLLFPVDRRVADGWEHWVLDPFDGGEESWEWLAELFTGRQVAGGRAQGGQSRAAEDDLERGRPMVIPAELLLPVFGEVPASGAHTDADWLPPVGREEAIPPSARISLELRRGRARSLRPVPAAPGARRCTRRWWCGSPASSTPRR